MIYADPPYAGRHVDYFNSWSEADEAELASLLKQMPCHFVLSTWHSNEFRKNLLIEQNWNEPRFHLLLREHFYHVGSTEDLRHPMIEALITNFPVRATQPETEEMRQMAFFERPASHLGLEFCGEIGSPLAGGRLHCAGQRASFPAQVGSYRTMNKTLVIMPTYNERENLPGMAARLAKLPAPVDLLMVDENSPDGTGQLADELAAKNPFINVLHQTEKNGLGRAYCAGFAWALQRLRTHHGDGWRFLP